MELWTLIPVFLVLIAVYVVFFKRPEHIPPGPIGLPYIGFVPKSLDIYQEICADLARKYGTVFSYYRFGHLIVLLNDYESINEIYVRQGEKVMDRPSGTLVRKLGNYGLVFNSGEQWRTHRRFSLSTLRNFGFGKPILENGINYEVDCLVEALKAEAGQIVDFQYTLNNAVANVICQLLFARRFDYSEEGFWDVINMVNKINTEVHPMSEAGTPSWYITLKMVFGDRKKLRNAIKVHDQYRSFITNLVNKHRSEYSPTQEPQDYIQAFAQKQHEQTPTFEDMQLYWATMNLFAAGMETTTSTIRWAILYCVLNPEIQERVHKEIVAVCGTTDHPRLLQRSELPYTEAVLLEAQRLGSIAPLVIRQSTEEVRYKQWRIPENTIFVANTRAVHMDPKVFPNPEKFLPERFLDPKTGRISKEMADQILPFGAGKRVCLGESLARMELSLIFSALVQQLKFSVPPGAPLPSTEPKTGIVSQPKPYTVLIELRN